MIDSHVHLAYWPVTTELEAAGVLGAVDLAAPEDRLPSAPHVIFSGPMLTRPGGYPLDSWGRDGYGIGCSDERCVRETIDRLAGKGARVIKLALDDGGLDPALAPIAVAAAHAKSLKVAAHALSRAGVEVAARAGVDVLAHTPTEPLDDAAVAAWKDRAVISTLAAFGGRDQTVENLRKLRAAGATILYGTDLGNQRDAGPSKEEISLLKQAGFDDAAIADAMTTAPARFWGIDLSTSYVVLDVDPRTDVTTYLSPRAVVLDGKKLR